ncbi:MAG TPA: tetratricopeptide repeat protein, partial [Pyrinomonadaceae bacterium]|nr:tetratricopeptide repeat protein [Pyrinomonadaceae bacterium]
EAAREAGVDETGEAFTAAAPRHAAASPVSRAARWLRTTFSGGKRQHTSSPASTAGHAHDSHTQASQDIHATPMTTSVGGHEKKSIAILPFKNIGNDAASAFYEFSLADAVITELARLRSLVVRPSSVIAKYQGQQFDPRDAGRELNVGSVLTAGFMHAAGRFRVTAQLLDVDTGDILWSDRVDADSADIIAVQDTIARRIVDGLRLELTPDEREKIQRPATRSGEAYEEYLRGRDFFLRFIFRTVAPEDCEAAVRHFERAVALDPEFALAHDGLGACYVNRVFKGLGGAEDYERAEASFQKALALDPKLPQARGLMAFVHLWRGEKEKARDEVERLRQESPNEPVVYFVKGTLHRLDGRYNRAMRNFDRLARFDPAARVVVAYNRALILIYMGRIEEAMQVLSEAAAIEPDNPLVKTHQALALHYSGDSAAAVELMRQVVAQHPNMHGVRPFLAVFLAAEGFREAALAEISEAVERNASVDPDIAYCLASAYALLEERDLAFRWLNTSVRLGNENRRCFEHDPNWQALRDDPRFRVLMERIAASRQI